MRDFRARVSVQEPSAHKRQAGRDHDAPQSPFSATTATNFFAPNATTGATSSEPELNRPVLAAPGVEGVGEQSPAHAPAREATPTQEESPGGLTTLQQPLKVSRSVSPLVVTKHSTHEMSPPPRTEGVARQGEEEEDEEEDRVVTVVNDKPKTVRSTSAMVKTPSIPECDDERAELPISRGRSYTLPRNMRLNPFSGEVERLERSKNVGPTHDEQVSVKSYHSLVIFSKYSSPNYGYSIEEYASSNISVLDQVANWDFPIFELREKAGDHILSQVRKGVGGWGYLLCSRGDECNVLQAYGRKMGHAVGIVAVFSSFV